MVCSLDLQPLLEAELAKPDDKEIIDFMERAYDGSKDLFFAYQREIEKKGYIHCFKIDTYTLYYLTLIRNESALIEQYNQLIVMCSPNSVSLTQNIKSLIWIKNEQIHYLWQISMVIRWMFRQYFGVAKYEHCGYFLDHYVIQMVHEYGYWVDHLATRLSIDFTVSKVAISSDDRYLFSVTNDESFVMITDLLTGQNIGKLDDSFTKGTVCLDFRCGMLVQGFYGSKIVLWDVYNLKLKSRLLGNAAFIQSVSFNGIGDQIVGGSGDGIIRVWSVDTGVCLRSFIGHSRQVKSVKFSGDLIISGALDRCIKLWDTSAGVELDSVNDEDLDNISEIEVNCDGTMIACLSHFGILVFSLPEMEVIQKLSMSPDKCCFHPSIPHMLAATNKDPPSLKVYDVISGDTIREFNCDSANITYHLYFSVDGLQLIYVYLPSIIGNFRFFSTFDDWKTQTPSTVIQSYSLRNPDQPSRILTTRDLRLLALFKSNHMENSICW